MRERGNQAKHHDSSSISQPIKDQLKLTTAIGPVPYSGKRKRDLKVFISGVEGSGWGDRAFNLSIVSKNKFCTLCHVTGRHMEVAEWMKVRKAGVQQKLYL